MKKKKPAQRRITNRELLESIAHRLQKVEGSVDALTETLLAFIDRTEGRFTTVEG